ncbi:MAG: class I SAM-dependent methyltransferase [Actinomycetota bacterium]
MPVDDIDRPRIIARMTGAARGHSEDHRGARRREWSRIGLVLRGLRRPKGIRRTLRWAAGRAKRVIDPGFRRGLPSRYQTLRREARAASGPRILEIGVSGGRSARLLIAEVLKTHGRAEYWGFDVFREHAAPELLARELSSMPLSEQDIRARLERRGATVHLLGGDSRETLRKARLPPMDLVFIDGGHSYETVASDWANVQAFLHDGSVVIFDDYTNEDGVVRGGYGVRALVDSIDRNRWRVELLPPVNEFKEEWGTLTTQLARVRRA